MMENEKFFCHSLSLYVASLLTLIVIGGERHNVNDGM